MVKKALYGTKACVALGAVLGLCSCSHLSNCEQNDFKHSVVGFNVIDATSQLYAAILSSDSQICDTVSGTADSVHADINYIHVVDNKLVSKDIPLSIQILKPVPTRVSADVLQKTIQDSSSVLPFPKYMNYCKVTVERNGSLIGIPQSASTLTGICSGAMIDVKNGKYEIDSFNAVWEPDFKTNSYNNYFSSADESGVGAPVDLSKIWDIPAGYQTSYTLMAEPLETLNETLETSVYENEAAAKNSALARSNEEISNKLQKVEGN